MTVSARRALAALVMLLAACFVLEWAWPGGADPAAPLGPVRLAGHPASGDRRGEPPPDRDTSAWGEAVLARPVFSISRRPPHVAAASHSDAPASQARLAGIMITGTGRRAIFAPEGGGKQLVLVEGAAVNDSTIQRIEPDRVTLVSGAVLLVSFDHNRVGPPPTTAPFQPAGLLPNGAFPGPGMVNPGFPNPNFPNPGMVNGFPNPNFPGAPGAMPGQVLPPGQQPGAPAADETNQPVSALPQVMRGTLIPQRRE